MAPVRLLAVLLLCLLAVSPALAEIEYTAEISALSESFVVDNVQTYSYDSTEEGKGIQRINIDLPTGSIVNFTLTYGDGSTVSGWAVYTNTGFYTQYTEVALGGIVSGYTAHVRPEEIGTVDIVGYAKNKTSDTTYQRGFIIYDSLYGVKGTETVTAFYPISGGNDGVIYKFDMTSNKRINSVKIYTADRDALGETVSKSAVDTVADWIAAAVQMAGTILELGLSAFYWGKFFLWDNIGMTVALYIALTGFMAFQKARYDILKGIQIFFGYQRSLFQFVLGIWESFVNILATFRGIFRV